MTEEDTDVFEITDFTTASEWERFIAKLEEAIHELKTPQDTFLPLQKGELTTGKWEEKQEDLQYADFRFTLTRHYLAQTVEEGEDSAKGTAAVETPDNERKPLPGKKQPEAEKPPIPWQDMMSLDNDFPGKAHCLCRWYGLRSFMVLQPGPKMDDIMSESRTKILQSSVAVAANNTNCHIPIFVAVQSKWRRLYLGSCELEGYRTSYEMVQLKHTPPQYYHLSGLLNIFKSKMACPIFPQPPVLVSVRFTYVLQQWGTEQAWLQGPVDLESTGLEQGEEQDGLAQEEENDAAISAFKQLPFGACEDPVSDLQLSTTWPALSEDMIVDADGYSDLNPIQAPIWSAKVRTTDDAQCRMGDYLEEFLLLCKRKESTDQLLGKSVTADTSPDAPAVSSALTRLTDPALTRLPTIGQVVTTTTTVVTRATGKLRHDDAPIATDLLNQLLVYLFPDAQDELLEHKNSQKDSRGEEKTETEEVAPVDESTNQHAGTSNSNHGDTDDVNTDLKTVLQDLNKQLKTAPESSLTHRLGVVVCLLNNGYGGVRAVAHLWHEFVLEMRYRLENNYIIPDLESGSPNMGCCLLHQKLQMLNCCIERKKAREATSSSSNSNISLTKRHSKNSNSQLSDSRQSSSKQCAGANTSISKRKSDSAVQKNTSWDWDETSLSISSDEEFFECEEDNNEETYEPMEISDTKRDSEATNEKMDVSSGGDVTEDSIGLKKGDLNTSVQSSHSGESQSQDSLSPEGSYMESWTHQPEGRKHKYMHYTLLGVPSEPLYVPVTQEPAPMTEDMLEEHADVLSKLGSSEEGSHLRARIQSACLLSDMESFRAANPGCTLADFVRWYSPRDWVETEEAGEDGQMVTRGELSRRMQIPGNMWVEVWQGARPVPARRQRRLFDDTKEAEKVLHWLSSLTPGNLATHLLPVVIHSALIRLHHQPESRSLPVVCQALAATTHRAAKVTRAGNPGLAKYEEILSRLAQIEQVTTRARSLLHKLVRHSDGVTGITEAQLQQFVSDVLQQSEVPVKGAARSAIGTIIHRLFQAAQKAAHMVNEEEDDNLSPSSSTKTTNSPGDVKKYSSYGTAAIPDFPAPAGKEYILRTRVVRPAPWSRPTPQRLYASLLSNDFRLMGAFSEDTTFQ